MNSPHEVGEEALTERSSLSGENGVALGKMVVVVVVVVIVLFVAVVFVVV